VEVKVEVIQIEDYVHYKNNKFVDVNTQDLCTKK
jgi:hypothetical protein